MADLTLVVADDRSNRLGTWISRLNGVNVVRDQFDIVELTGHELQAELDELSARRRAGRDQTQRTELLSQIDKADLLIVDYDLTDLDRHSTETGVGVAYLARCFSDCGYVVALNQYGDNPFDLSGVGDFSGFADLDIGGDQLHNPGLWTGSGWPEFRPWAWPLLPAEIARLQQLTTVVQDVGLDARLFETLGLEQNLAVSLAPEAAAHLGDRDPAQATFASLLAEPSMGLRRDDRIVKPERAARTAAARAMQWIERWILAAQDRLVDAPHLGARYPSQADDLAATVSSVDPAATPALRSEFLDAHRYSGHGPWLSRPAWWAGKVAADERIPEVEDPWSAPDSDVVFAEDTSAFIERAEAVAYRVEVPADSRVRYVKRLDGIDYRPIANFARV